MEQDLLTNLPQELITIILLKLPLPAIAISKCVSKSLLDLLESDTFLKYYLSKSTGALAVLTKSSRCTVFDLEDEVDVDQSFDCGYNIAERGLICVGKDDVNADAVYLCNPLTNFVFPHENVRIEGSANGLLFIHKYSLNGDALFVSNPITREYFELPCPKEIFIPLIYTYGFGVSKITSQYKVVQIYDHGCHVHTLGTRSWRRVEAPPTSFAYDSCLGAFVNGNLHWLVAAASVDTLCVSCFDIETECFSTFFDTPFKEGKYTFGLHVLRDCLCYCDTISQKGQIVIWLMNEYGDENSWIKEYVIDLYPEIAEIDDDDDDDDDGGGDGDGGDGGDDDYGYGYGDGDDYSVFVYPIKVLEGGGILMVWESEFISYYSKKSKTTQNIGAFDVRGGARAIDSMLLTPSFLSLKRFGMENLGQSKFSETATC